MLDLIIRNCRTINGDKFEIGIKGSEINVVSSKITKESREEIRLKSDQYISAGWIDDHVHCFEKMNLYYDYPDQVGVYSGVTTVIDAGTSGSENLPYFYDQTKKSKTNVYALLNISKYGIVEQNELADLTKIDEKAIKQIIKTYPGFIVGLKSRMSKSVVGNNGLLPLVLAKKIQIENGKLPLMCHIGTSPPDLNDILKQMESGDVITHCFNGKANGILESTGEIKDVVNEAYKRGVVFDIGHGSDSFNFNVAEKAFSEGIKAHSISTDIYIRNRKYGPVFDLATTMEKMFLVGYSWEEIIDKVTCMPAEVFGLSKKGKILRGYDADLTIFKFDNKKKQLIDSNGNIRESTEQIIPISAIIGGVIYDIS